MPGTLVPMMPYQVERIVVERLKATEAPGRPVSIRTEVDEARRRLAPWRPSDDELIMLVEHCVVGRASVVLFDAHRPAKAA